MRIFITAFFRRIQTRLLLLGKSSYLSFGTNIHIGKGTSLWAPKLLRIGNGVFMGKHVHIAANCEIGDYCLLANRVAIVGRHDHDFTAIGFPVRYSPWIGSHRFPSSHADEKAIIESDVWLGYGVIVLTGRGAIVAAGSVVTKDILPYSIAAGVPARVIGQRFSDMQTINKHEKAICKGHFELSERGFDHCRIEPGKVEL